MHKRYHILYVEDDEALAFVTKDNLELFHFTVTHHATGAHVLEDFSNHSYDLCILDIMVPHTDGFELAAGIRKLNNEVPIIFLSAKTLKEDRVKGLKLGADDYLVKPFSIEELVLKMEVFLQRSRKNTLPPTSYTVGKFRFNAQNYELDYNGSTSLLTQREADLLLLFIKNPDRVIKREEILKSLWGSDDYFTGRSLDVFISRLRKHLCQDTQLVIENLHGIGFRFMVKRN